MPLSKRRVPWKENIAFSPRFTFQVVRTFIFFHRYSITSHLKKHLFCGGGGFGKENRSSSKNRNWKQPWIYITNDVVAKTVHPLKKRNNQQTENFGG